MGRMPATEAGDKVGNDLAREAPLLRDAGKCVQSMKWTTNRPGRSR